MLLNLKNYSPDENSAAYYSLADKWILSRVNQLIQNVRNALGEYKFNEAASFLYQFIWHEFCDWYVEFSKQELSNTNDESSSRKAIQQILLEVLNIILKLLHPFMPFITEEIWQKLPGNKGSIMVSPLPRKNDSLINSPAEEALEIIKEVVYHIRNIRGEMHIPPSQKIEAVLFCEDDKTTRLLENYQNYLMYLALLKNLTFSTSRKKPHAAATAIVKGVEIFIPLEGLIDLRRREKT